MGVTVVHVRPQTAPPEDSLRRSDVDVEAVHTASGALSHVADDVDAVVCDAAFGDGQESVSDVVERIRGRDADVPILVRSDDVDGAVAARVTQAGATEYVPDPVLEADGDQLVDRVAAVIDQNRRPAKVSPAVDADHARDGGVHREAGDVVSPSRSQHHERITDAFFALDSAYRFTYVNEKAAELLGRPESELLGDSIWEIFPQAGKTTFQAKFRTAMATQETVSFEEYFPPLQSWFVVRVYPSQTGLSIYFRDITERKHFEEALALLHGASRELFRAESKSDIADAVVETATDVLDLSGVAVYHHDPDAGELYPVAESAGVSLMRDELPIIPDDDSTLTGHIYQTGETEYVENILDSPYLQVDESETSMRAGLFVPLGEYGIVVVGAEDEDAFSERAQQLVDVLGSNAEAAYEAVERERVLEESRRRYRTLIDNFPNGAVVLFDDDVRYRVAGGKFVEELGLTEADLMGERPEDVLPSELAGALQPAFSAALDGERTAFEFDHGGQVRKFHAVPVRDEDGEVFAGMATSQDITERRERERELTRRVRQQEVVSELGERALASQSLDGLMEEASRLVAETLDAEYAKVLDFDAGGDEMRLCAGYGWDDGYVGRARVSAEWVTQAGYTLGHEEPVAVSDFASDDRFRRSALLDAHDVSSGVSAVLGPPEDPWGVFSVHDEAVREFSEHDVNFVQSVANILTNAIEQTEYESTLERQRTQLAAINQLSSVVRDINQKLTHQSTREDIEQVVCERLAASTSYAFAWIGDVTEMGDFFVRTEAGVEGYLDDIDVSVADMGPTATAFRTGEMRVTGDVQTDPNYTSWRDHAESHGYRSSAAIPILYEGERYGVLNVYATRTNAFSGREREVLQHLAEVIGLAIAAVEREQTLRVREKQYRALVENIPNGGVALFDETLRYTRAGGRILADLDVPPEELVGERVGDADVLPPSVTERLEDTYRRAIDGDVVETELEIRGRTFRIHAVPVLLDDDQVGGMSLVQDITEQKEREVELEREQERLEFLNRILRHNLLNGLNVVEARAELLDGWVDPEAQYHLETLSNRIEQLTSFVETMRSFTNSVVHGEEQDLTAIHVGDVVKREVAKLRQSHEVEITADVPDVDVVADDLLDAVLENILSNAVHHTDKEVPQIEVTGECCADSVRIHVADDGPGIPDRKKQRVLEKGKKGLSSPGTGLGLYLVRETVEAYGGEVSIRDNEPEGTVFTVELQRALPATGGESGSVTG